ncbi:membrane protein [Mycolicibacterium chitae]|uniref:Conserved exported protein of uncharacterized function n=1 Tax=Mycolicibacterium chitae TaxID=1792 RepID=A0A3S5EIH1_MYCCI|nr:DUF3558 domain-containing protein [Mycolicibacterium chitae]MCV7105232.1 DUF3558 domain-containing protein [Mycolicibacterium chitae]BBZ05021.1 membrane protein [Mycolicibacterium chitae]VEG48642.1 Conserved exported protein of uncharacterised function [Mycolicibacterium chitae]
MVAKMRLFAALGAVFTAALVAVQTTLPAGPAPTEVALRSTDAPITSTPRSPVIDFTDPEPFNPCTDIPLDVINGLGLGFAPPEQENSLRCKYDAGPYQMAVEAIIWRTYEKSLPPDAVELDINGHRAAQFWVMKPTDWNNRWWITCMITFRTDYGVIQQSLFYSPIHSPSRPDCMQENLMRAHQLTPHYKF